MHPPVDSLIPLPNRPLFRVGGYWSPVGLQEGSSIPRPGLRSDVRRSKVSHPTQVMIITGQALLGRNRFQQHFWKLPRLSPSLSLTETMLLSALGSFLSWSWAFLCS